MPEIYRNGRDYSASVPAGGLEGQVLIKRSDVSGDVMWDDAGGGGGAIFCYIVGETPYASDWLSLEEDGDPLQPKDGLLYLVLTSGDYYNSLYRFNASTDKYVLVLSDDGGVVYSNIDSTKTALNPDWLKNTNNNTIMPKAGMLYVILTSGDYYNSIYRFDTTTNKYVLVVSGMGGVVFSTIDSTKTALNSDWLKNQNNNTIVPQVGVLYLVLTSGDYYHSIFRYDAGTSKYVQVSDGSICGIVISTINSSGTLLSANWLKNLNNNVITPKAGYVYLVITDGVYKNNYYRYDFGTSKYVLINRPGHYIQNKGAATNFRNNLNLFGFDFTDDSEHDATVVKEHLLTDGEIMEILSPMPNSSGEFISNYLIAAPYNAASAYAVGDYFYREDTLYLVIQAKAAGTDVPPPNASYYMPTSVGARLKAGLQTQNVTSGATVNTTYVQSYDGLSVLRVNNLVMLSLSGVTFKTTGTISNVITGLPKAVIKTIANYIGQDGLKTAQVNASGTVAYIDANATSLSSFVGTAEKLWVYMTYLTD